MEKEKIQIYLVGETHINRIYMEVSGYFNAYLSEYRKLTDEYKKIIGIILDLLEVCVEYIDEYLEYLENVHPAKIYEEIPKFEVDDGVPKGLEKVAAKYIEFEEFKKIVESLDSVWGSKIPKNLVEVSKKFVKAMELFYKKQEKWGNFESKKLHKILLKVYYADRADFAMYVANKLREAGAFMPITKQIKSAQKKGESVMFIAGSAHFLIYKRVFSVLEKIMNFDVELLDLGWMNGTLDTAALRIGSMKTKMKKSGSI